MNEAQIESIVQAVLGELGEAKNSGTITEVAAGIVSQLDATGKATQAPRSNGLGCIELTDDLASDKFKNWIGVKNANKPDVNENMRKQTTARILVGRCGPRPTTIPLLRFSADHSRSKDTVIKEVAPEWLEKHRLLEVKSQITNKEQYLTRPDLGRRLDEESKQLILENCKKSPQVQLVVSDGLSTDAITNNYDEILPPLLKGLENAGLNVGTPFFLRYGRVKAQDEIGELLDAEVNLLLIGERPGLGQSESLSCYAIYRPNTTTTVESDRTVISNIHAGGTPPVEAAAVIVELAREMLAKKASGIGLKG
ncbi:Ethanolamine ammonia-lyase light chain [Sinobacterium norvegicum]|uniref:Ethanolamine ammonia-lyase small subunit n=2 Tax=Sinobacterium norvegicum TaxID=1641715 RepID=A0ABM9AB61_9GAMM|nr:Ethanolamine ammonia-lyase light chain [Sinobacterium norvegicum]